MKIIDLLIKRANGEKMPIKIKYDLKEYIYCGYDYKINDVEKQNDDDYNLWNNLDMYKLNNEIEIIEEDKKIKMLEPISGSELVDLRDKDQIKSNKSLTYLILKLNEMNKKINELLYEINKLKEEGK